MSGVEPQFNTPPDTFGVGYVSCPCGEMKLTVTDAHQAIAMRVSCPFCGGIAEAVADA